MQVRLTQKLANTLDGVDVSRIRVGDIFDLPDADAAALIAEGWAAPLIPLRSNSNANASLDRLTVIDPTDPDERETP